MVFGRKILFILLGKRKRGSGGESFLHYFSFPEFFVDVVLKFLLGIKPHAVGKRTPRVPVSYYDKDNAEKYFSPARQGSKQKVDSKDDDVAHEIALVLTEASQRGGSPQLSRTPNRKAKGARPSPVKNGERMVSKHFI